MDGIGLGHTVEKFRMKINFFTGCFFFILINCYGETKIYVKFKSWKMFNARNRFLRSLPIPVVVALGGREDGFVMPFCRR